MSETDGILNEFLRRYLVDREQGTARSCSEYQALFPGHEALIAKEHERLAAEESEADRSQGLPQIAGFHLLQEIGRGGMGVVYLAEQVSLRRKVALKVLPAHLTLSSRQVERFRREATAVAKLSHPLIVPIYEVGEQGGTHYFAMEFVQGGSLAAALEAARSANAEHPEQRGLDLLKQKSLAAQSAELTAQVASALAYAHGQGIIHRDIKPQNILLAADHTIRLVDFGLAKDVGEESLSMTGEIGGTPCYMSPEQALAKRVMVDHRADLFSLGVVLYEMLTLERPFHGDTSQKVLHAICFEEPRSIRKLNPRVPRDLEIICSKALEKNPARRYATAQEMAEDLQRFVRLEPIHARPAGPTTRILKWTRRRPAIATAALVAVAFVALVTAWSISRDLHAQHRFTSELAQAETAEREGRLDDAMRHAEAALALGRDVPLASATLRSYANEKELNATQAAREAEQKALARWDGLRLAAESAAALDHDPTLALLLAIESAKRNPSAEADEALRAALATRRETRAFADQDSASFSPTGDRLLTYSHEDGSVNVWNIATGRRITGFTVANLISASFSPDGRRILTFLRPDIPNGGGPIEPFEYPAVRIWDVLTGEALLTIKAPKAYVVDAKFSRDGSRVLTANEFGPSAVTFWDAASGAVLKSFPRSGSTRLYSASLSPDDRLVAMVFEGTAGVVVWDSSAGLEPAFSIPAEPHVNSIDFSPDGAWLVTGTEDGRARLYDTRTGNLVKVFQHLVDSTLPTREPLRATFSDDGSFLLTVPGLAGSGVVWDARSGKRLQEIDRSGDSRHIGWSRDAQKLVAVGSDGVVRMYNTMTGKITAKFGADISNPIASPDGAWLVTINHKWPGADSNNMVKLWDLRTSSTGPFGTLGDDSSDGDIMGASFNPDGRSIGVVQRDGTVRLFAADSRLPLLTIKTGQSSWPSFSRSGRRLMARTQDGNLGVWEVETGTLVASFTAQGEPAFRPWLDREGRRAVVYSRQRDHLASNVVQIIDTDTGKEIHRHPVSGWFSIPYPVTDPYVVVPEESGTLLLSVKDGSEGMRYEGIDQIVAMSEDGTRMVAGAAGDRPWCLFDAVTRNVIAEVAPRQSYLLAYFSPDATLVLICQDDHTPELFDARLGDLLGTLPIHEAIQFAKFSADGARIITHFPGTSVIFDVSSQRRLLTIQHAKSGLDMSPDGQRFVSIGPNGPCVLPVDPLPAAIASKARELTPHELEKFEIDAARR